MNNQHKYYFLSFFTGIVFCLLLQYVSCNETVIQTTPAKEITSAAEKEVKPLDSAINNLQKERQKSRDSLVMLNKKLYAAWQENKRLRAISPNSMILKVSNSTPLQSSNDSSVSEIPNSSQDYITDLQIASQIADSLCAETITQYETTLSISDSIATHEKAKGEIYRVAMNNLAVQSDLKDKAIKSITRQLKWHKVGLKAILIGAAAIIIKNQL